MARRSIAGKLITELPEIDSSDYSTSPRRPSLEAPPAQYLLSPRRSVHLGSTASLLHEDSGRRFSRTLDRRQSRRDTWSRTTLDCFRRDSKSSNCGWGSSPQRGSKGRFGLPDVVSTKSLNTPRTRGSFEESTRSSSHQTTRRLPSQLPPASPRSPAQEQRAPERRPEPRLSAEDIDREMLEAIEGMRAEAVKLPEPTPQDYITQTLMAHLPSVEKPSFAQDILLSMEKQEKLRNEIAHRPRFSASGVAGSNALVALDAMVEEKISMVQAKINEVRCQNLLTGNIAKDREMMVEMEAHVAADRLRGGANRRPSAAMRS